VKRLTCFIALAALACSRRGTPEQTKPRSPAAPSAVPLAAPGASALPSNEGTRPAFQGSVYDLSATLTGHDGKPTPLDVFRGHPVIITMFYGSCPNACPLLTSDIQRIDRQLSPGARERVRVLMVSFDAPRDTPAKLQKFMTEHALDASRWKLASAPEDPARELAAVLGIRYRKLDDGEYFHSSSIILLDEQGKPTARVEGIGKDPAPILAALH
jgi:protein SCO1/2